MPSKISVLLIADRAQHLSLDSIPDFDCAPERDGLEIADYFEIHWLAAPQECRAYYDLTSQIDAKNPKGLLSNLPDLLLVDYALSNSDAVIDNIANIAEETSADFREAQSQCRPFAMPVEVFLSLKFSAVQDVVSRISPLPSLRESAVASGVPNCEIEKTVFTKDELRFLPEDANYVVHPNAKAPGNCVGYQKDHMGALAGMTIYDKFASRYPIAFVAHTQVESQHIANTPTTFLEYMHEREAGETFKNKGNKASSWKNLIYEGVKTYRKRALEMAQNGYVSFALDTLLALADENVEDLPKEIRIKSAFGTKELPLNGLFVDYEDPNKRRQAACEWANAVLQGICASQSAALMENQLAQAYQISLELFKRYCSRDWRNLRDERYELSRLIADVFDYFQRADDDWENAQRIFAKRAENIRVSEEYLQYCVADEIERQSQRDGRTVDEYIECFKKLFNKQVEDVRHVASPPCIENSYTILHCNCREGRVLRFATLFTYARLLTLLLKFLTFEENRVGRARNFANQKSFKELMAGTGFDPRLLYDALFPLPARPIILPWEPRGTNDPSGAWPIGRRFGRENNISVPDLAHGDVNVLKPGEQFILESFWVGLNSEVINGGKL